MGWLLPAAAAAALWGVATRSGLPAAAALGLAGGAALTVGIVLAVQAQRGLLVATAALEQLQQGLPVVLAPSQMSWPVGALLAQIAALGSSEGRLGAARGQLLRQTAAAAAQEERNRLARDLHDSIKQQIFAISVNAATAQARWEQDPHRARAALDEVRRGAQEAMVEMRAMLQQLRPAPLETVGLVEALRDQGAALGYRTGATVEVTFGELPTDERLPIGAQESLFRIAQEALANVARHARAEKVRVRLQVDTDGGREAPLLLLEIADDGQGFDPRAPTAGSGLSNMSERVRALGGTLEVRSARGEGTKIRASVPLEAPAAAPSGAHALPQRLARTIAAVMTLVGVVAAAVAGAASRPALAAVLVAGAVLAGAAALVPGNRRPTTAVPAPDGDESIEGTAEGERR